MPEGQKANMKLRFRNVQSRTTVKKIVGIALIIVGVAGWFLPLFPGWFLVIIGVEIMGWRLMIPSERIAAFWRRVHPRT